VEVVLPQPGSTMQPAQQPVRDPVAPIANCPVNVAPISNCPVDVATGVSVALVTVIIWFLLSMTMSRLVLFIQPIYPSHILPVPFSSQGTPIMDTGEMFNWPDGDVVLRSTHDAETRDFRVHRLCLSYASPVFKDALTDPRCTCSSTTVCLINMDDPPRAVELILRFIYSSPVPVVLDDLATVSEALTIANTYQIEVARSQLRSSLVRLAETEPLRVYAIAYRFGFENEMKIASKNMLSINIPALTELPDEFKSVPATEYHRLIRLHTRYRDEAMAVTTKSLPGIFDAIGEAFGVLQFVEPSALGEKITGAAMIKPIIDIIMKGTPLDYGVLALVMVLVLRLRGVRGLFALFSITSMP